MGLSTNGKPITPYKNSRADEMSRPKSKEPVYYNPAAANPIFQNSIHHQNVMSYLGHPTCGALPDNIYIRAEEEVLKIYVEKGWARRTGTVVATFNPLTTKTPYG